MSAVRTPIARRAARPRPRPAVPFINRELSWLDFNARVLYEATDPRNPLLERTRFLAIFARNLDEFFQVRVAGLKQQLEAGHSSPSPDGRPAGETLAAIREAVLELTAQHSAAFATIREGLAADGVRIVGYHERPERHLELRRMFIDQIFPVLTPLAVDPGHPFPYISDLSLSLAVTVRDPESGERRFARIKVPPVLPRLVEVGVRTYLLLEQVIAANLDALFPGMEVVEHHLFRVTRNADLAIEEDEADDLLLAIEEELRRRRFGEAVRLEVERSMPAETRTLLQRGLDLAPGDVYEIAGMLDLTALDALADLDLPALQLPPWHPVTPHRLLPHDGDEEADVFAAIRAGDLLVHHPYEILRRLRPALHRAGRRRPGRADHQADALPHERRFAHRQGAHPGRREGQAGRRAGGDQGPLRRAGEHRVGARPGARRRPRGVRAGGPEDALEDGARGAPRGPRAAPLRAHRDGQLQPAHGAHVRGSGALHCRRRSSAPTSPTCSTSSPASRGSGGSGSCSWRRPACASGSWS